MFARFSDHNHYRSRQLYRPRSTLPARRLRRGDLLSIAELAALVHLPLDVHVPNLARAGALVIAPTPTVPIHGPDG